jgi:hypothetical protein
MVGSGGGFAAGSKKNFELFVGGIVFFVSLPCKVLK